MDCMRKSLKGFAATITETSFDEGFVKLERLAGSWGSVSAILGKWGELTVGPARQVSARENMLSAIGSAIKIVIQTCSLLHCSQTPPYNHFSFAGTPICSHIATDRFLNSKMPLDVCVRGGGDNSDWRLLGGCSAIAWRLLGDCAGKRLTSASQPANQLAGKAQAMARGTDVEQHVLPAFAELAIRRKGLAQADAHLRCRSVATKITKGWVE